jgi:hypothetical protein
MPITLTYTQRTSYQGTDFTYFGGEPFVWDGTQYIPGTSLPISNTNTASRKVVLQFSAKLFQPEKSSTTILNTDVIEVYVDNVMLDEDSGVEKTQRYIQLTLDDAYLRTQRLIEFKSNKGDCKTKFAVKTAVYSDNDVVIAKYSDTDPQPIIGNVPAPSDFPANPTTTFGQPNTVIDTNRAAQYQTQYNSSYGGSYTNNTYGFGG